MKGYIKKKEGPNQSGPGYRTSDHFKGSLFGGGKSFGQKQSLPKFNKAQFRTQHKGG